MKNGLLDPGLVSFVFAPLLVTLAAAGAFVWRQMRNGDGGIDAPARLLAAAIRAMPGGRREWGAAMLAELSHIHKPATRWRFALSSARAALFAPPGDGLSQPVASSRQPYCGMLAVSLPPLGLPLIYFAAVFIEALGGSPLTQTERWNHPDLVMAILKLIILLTVACLVAGLPLGLAGWWRGERWRVLSQAGIVSSVCIAGYFLFVMSLVAGGGPNGD